MSSNSVYKKKFEEMLHIEEQARDLYKYYIKRIEDPALLEKLQEIYKDEEKHVKIVQHFIDMISKE